MLAIVCRSLEAAGALEKFVQKPEKPINGEVESMHALCEPAVPQKPTHGRSFVICLEDIRPYTGDFDRSDPQRKLALPDPVLPSGMAPDGFLGYAVNMFDLDSHHIHTVTSEGHGLRETVLYCLLGELQVYNTREDMLAARACIKHGAISLDGGILKQNGVTSFGAGDVEICSPVAKNLELPPSNVVDVEKQIEEKKSAERRVRGKPFSKVGKWALLNDVPPPLSRVRVGSVFPPLSIACYDVYGNQIPFATTLEVSVKVQTNEGLIFRVEKFIQESSNYTWTIKDMLMESDESDKLRPPYETTLVVCSEDDKFSVSVPFEVSPGPFENQVHSGYTIQEFILELFNQYGTEFQLNVEGFSIQDRLSTARSADHHGCIDLGGLLTVTAGSEKNVSISVCSINDVLLKLQSQTEKRVLRISSKVPVVQPVNEKYDQLLIKKEKQGDSPSLWEVSPLQVFSKQVGNLRVLKVEHQGYQSPSSIGNTFPSPDSSCLLQLENFEELKNIMHKHGTHIGRMEDKLKIVEKRKANVQQELSDLLGKGTIMGAFGVYYGYTQGIAVFVNSRRTYNVDIYKYFVDTAVKYGLISRESDIFFMGAGRLAQTRELARALAFYVKTAEIYFENTNVVITVQDALALTQMYLHAFVRNNPTYSGIFGGLLIGPGSDEKYKAFRICVRDNEVIPPSSLTTSRYLVLGSATEFARANLEEMLGDDYVPSARRAINIIGATTFNTSINTTSVGGNTYAFLFRDGMKANIMPDIALDPLKANIMPDIALDPFSVHVTRHADESERLILLLVERNAAEIYNLVEAELITWPHVVCTSRVASWNGYYYYRVLCNNAARAIGAFRRMMQQAAPADERDMLIHPDFQFFRWNIGGLMRTAYAAQCSLRLVQFLRDFM